MVKLKSLVVTMVGRNRFLRSCDFRCLSTAYAGSCDKGPEMTKVIVMGDWLAWAVQAAR